jgi:hypothetical protein
MCGTPPAAALTGQSETHSIVPGGAVRPGDRSLKDRSECRLHRK